MPPLAAPAGAAASAAGRLVLDPRGAAPIRGGRPAVDGEVLRRLTEDRRAAMLPDLLAALFSLCGAVHRLTARRAVAAALGLPETEAQARAAALALRVATLRDHLQRLALDLPARVPVGVNPAPAWLAGAPVMTPSERAEERADVLRRMPAWLEQRLLGAPPQAWWTAWRADPAGAAAHWLTGWAAGQNHPVVRWHAAVRARAESLRLPCRPLALLDGGPAQAQTALRALAHALAGDAGFAARPTWQGLPAETGPWTRGGDAGAGADARLDSGPDTAWLRLTARIADLARVAVDEQALRHGRLTLGGGEGLAWSEMARGLLVHWVRLAPGTDDPALARVQCCRVLAPTEWNFHPDGALAHWLRGGAPDAADVALMAAALDPCVECEIRGAAPAAADGAPRA